MSSLQNIIAWLWLIGQYSLPCYTVGVGSNLTEERNSLFTSAFTTYWQVLWGTGVIEEKISYIAIGWNWIYVLLFIRRGFWPLDQRGRYINRYQEKYQHRIWKDKFSSWRSSEQPQTLTTKNKPEYINTVSRRYLHRYTSKLEAPLLRLALGTAFHTWVLAIP